ncbi:hypothetical protein KSP40_PGU019304 [Platanthera guangdongensis]|uniref:Uncharacterized protein n=1 Tax=Platanthera guangdongensis TaxID=2320717 RepID=A0ABR2N2B7_9ASPA
MLLTILFMECSDFINDCELGSEDLDQKACILQSDYWALRTEVQLWTRRRSNASDRVKRRSRHAFNSFEGKT